MKAVEPGDDLATVRAALSRPGPRGRSARPGQAAELDPTRRHSDLDNSICYLVNGSRRDPDASARRGGAIGLEPCPDSEGTRRESAPSINASERTRRSSFALESSA
jgi:hypothetical protein